MHDLNGRLARALPTVNVVGLVVAVAVLWWRAAVLEAAVRDLTSAVHRLQVDVAVLCHSLQADPCPEK